MPTGWTDNYAQAMETAKTDKKYLLLDFTGSDWCGFCKILEKEVFSTAQFGSWAKKNIVLVQVDFHHQTPQTAEVKKQNSKLAAKYPIHGYPMIVVIKPGGAKEIAKTIGYPPGTGATAYIKELEARMKKAGPLPGTANGGSNNGSPKEPSNFKTTPIPSTLR